MGGDASSHKHDGGRSADGDGGGGTMSRVEGRGPPDAWTAPDVGTPVEAGSPGQVDLTLHVSTTEDVQQISPYIYGVNDVSQAASVHATIVRIGGNRLTA